MASTHCSAFPLISPSTTRRNLPLIVASSKTRHRKNYLRPKILKTLNPITYPTVSPPLLPPPENPVLLPQEDELCFEAPTADEAHIAGETDKLEDLRVSEAAAVAHNGVVYRNVSAKDIFKYGGMCFVGALVFQTIYSVWILSNYVANEEDEELEVSGRGKRNYIFDGNGKTVLVTGGGNGFDVEDQLEMEEKVKEIKLMAREVRRVELEKKEDEGLEVDDESSVSSNRLGIEKEIGARLLKLQSRISDSNKDSSAALRSNARGNSAAGIDRDGNKNVSQGNEGLVFKKKLKFRSPSTKVAKTPKGFTGTQNSKGSITKKEDSTVKSRTQGSGSDATDHEGVLYEDKQVNQQDVVTDKSTSSVPWEESGKVVDDESREILNHGKNLKEKMETPNKKTEVPAKANSNDNGGVQETSVGMSSLEEIQLKDSSETRAQNSQGFVGENRDTSPILEKDNVHSINGSSRHGLAKKKSADNRVKAKQANTKIDKWWLNLRYVLVILMQRGSSGEGGKGLYSVKFTSKEQGQSDDSYTVAFEDHADANNFCFLLDSFFGDLGDFSANAVPMSIQELNEEIISRAKKVVVVKKRQLQLYAGQPLTDVEMALCSIIEQDQNAS